MDHAVHGVVIMVDVVPAASVLEATPAVIEMETAGAALAVVQMVVREPHAGQLSGPKNGHRWMLKKLPINTSRLTLMAYPSKIETAPTKSMTAQY